MSEFYAFAGEHPVLTVVLASMLLSAVVKLLPWSRRDRGEDG